MKTRYVLLVLFTFGLAFNAEAQFLKKLKKRAEEAAADAVMRKVEEKATRSTENTMDTILNADKKLKRKNRGNDSDDELEEEEVYVDESTSGSGDMDSNTISNTPGMNPIMGGGAGKSNLPSSYDFDWEYQTEIVTGEDQKIEMNYLINTTTTDYFGMEMSTEESKGQGDMRMVMDSKNKKTIMLMEGNGQKMAQVMKMPNANGKTKGNADNYKFTEIGSKTILGYECFGMQVEDTKYIATMYYTLDAPVTFSALFGMANMKNAPKGFDPALIQVLAEESLLMEMTATNKKKTKESFTMTAKSLNPKPTSLQMSEYQVMGLGGF